MAELTVATKKRHVLVVAEGHAYTQETEQALRRVDRAVVTFHLPDGQTALEHFAKCGHGYGMPDLVLLDRVFPHGPDGLAILSILRQMEPLAHLPVFIVSGSDDEEHVAQATMAGASGFLIRPSEKSQYLAFAQQVLAWRPRPEIAHDLSTLLAQVSSPPAQAPLASRAMPSASPAFAASSGQPNLLAALWGGLTAYVPELRQLGPELLEGVFVDQDDADVTFAERQARITRWEVVNVRDKDQEMERKRRKFYGILIRREWGLSQIQKRFPTAKTDYLKKIRADVRNPRTDRALPPS